MPGNSEGLWYSFNMGPVHFVAIETEAYYFMNYGLKQLVKQYEWLDNDLTEANKPETRLVYKQKLLLMNIYVIFSTLIFLVLKDHG